MALTGNAQCLAYDISWRPILVACQLRQQQYAGRCCWRMFPFDGQKATGQDFCCICQALGMMQKLSSLLIGC